MPRRASIIIDVLDRASPAFGKIRFGLQALGGVAAAVGAYQIGRLLVNGMQASVKAAAEQETAERKLAVALRNSGQSVSDQLPRLREYAQALARQTGISDDAILSGQHLLVSMGKLRGEGLERATRAALDLSVKTGSVESAFELLAKAAAGNTSQLGRYGIVLDESVPKSERFAAAVRKVEEVFGGQAAEQAKTFAGAVARANEGLNELAETIGGPLTETGTILLNDFLTPLIEDLNDSTTAAGAFREGLLLAAAGMVPLVAGVELLIRNLAQLQRVGLPSWTRFLGAANLNIGAILSQSQAAVRVMSVGIQTWTPVADRLERAVHAAREAGPRDVAQDETLNTARELAEETESWAESMMRAKIPLEEVRIGYSQLADFDQIFQEDLERLAEGWFFVSDATDESVQSAEELNQAIERAHQRTMTLATTVRQALGGALEDAALNFGDTMVDAAFGAKVAWGDFAKQLLSDLAKAIVQAIILKQIMAGTGWFGWIGSVAPLPQAGGGRIPGFAPMRGQTGLRIPGAPNRGDAVPAMLTAGELVLNQDQQRNLLNPLGGRAGQLTLRIEVGPNMRQLADRLSVEVERGGARIVASELVQPSRGRRI